MDRITNQRNSLKGPEPASEPPKTAVNHQHQHSKHFHGPSSPILQSPQSYYSHRYSPYTPPQLSRYRYHTVSSSPDIQFDPADDPTLFPHIGTWLQSLSEGPRGADGDDFTQFEHVLVSNGYKRVFHLARQGFSVEELQRICENQISDGLAFTLLDYARRDTQKIIMEETRRRRKQHNEPRRYI